jgi:hypothetical protein
MGYVGGRVFFRGEDGMEFETTGASTRLGPKSCCSESKRATLPDLQGSRFSSFSLGLPLCRHPVAKPRPLSVHPSPRTTTLRSVDMRRAPAVELQGLAASGRYALSCHPRLGLTARSPSMIGAASRRLGRQALDLAGCLSAALRMNCCFESFCRAVILDLSSCRQVRLPNRARGG